MLLRSFRAPAALLPAIVAIAILAGSGPASAGMVKRWVYNKTTHCIYFKVGDVVGRLFDQWVHPGTFYVTEVGTSASMYVEAYVTKTAACASGTLDYLIIRERSHTPLGPSETTVYETAPNKFGIRWGK